MSSSEETFLEERRGSAGMAASARRWGRSGRDDERESIEAFCGQYDWLIVEFCEPNCPGVPWSQTLRATLQGLCRAYASAESLPGILPLCHLLLAILGAHFSRRPKYLTNPLRS